MALQTGFMKPEDREWYFIKVGISAISAKIHAAKFADEKLTDTGLINVNEAESHINVHP